MPTFPPGASTDMQGQAVLIGNPEVYDMPAPASYSGAVTLLSTDITGGIIVVGTGGVGINVTLPTAALLVSALKAIFGLQLAIGSTIGCLIINGGSAGSITLLLGSGGSFDGNQNAASQVITTATSKYVMFRLTNITLGSEAYTVYS